jgi:DNA-binding NtrC family response regulator
VAELAGDKEGAASASLTICEELHDSIPRRELLSAYADADSRAGDSPQPATLRRLRACARLLFNTGPGLRRLTTSEILNASPEVVELLSTARLVAPTTSPVLITGEPGTGRRTLAELIHRWSGRPGGFVALPCAKLPDDWHSRPDAERGTLYLDGVSDLSRDDQARLLGLVESPHVEGAHPRVIVSADKDLSVSVADGDFMASLYYRLTGLWLDVPPLRDRPDDVAVLFRMFADEASREFGCEAHFSDEAVERLKQLPLFGNIPELRAIVARLVMKRRGQVVSPGDVELAARDMGPPGRTDRWHPCDLRAEMRKLERYHIENALRAVNGQVTKAAPLLGIRNTETLAAKIRRHPDLLRSRSPVVPRMSARKRRRRLKIVTPRKAD